MKTKITVNLILFVLIVSCVSDAALVHLLALQASVNAAIYFRKLGGRWGDDWMRSIVGPAYWKCRSYRNDMECYCLYYRGSLIFSVIFLASALVAGFDFRIEL